MCGMSSKLHITSVNEKKVFKIVILGKTMLTLHYHSCEERYQVQKFLNQLKSRLQVKT